jgi:prephenate dehydrogenase
VWALCPTEHPNHAALRAVLDYVEIVQNDPYLFSPYEHDEAMALISHAPHVISSAIAALFSEANVRTVAASGTGLRDMTRIAKGNVMVWSDIILSNRRHLSTILQQVASQLNTVAAELVARTTTNETELPEPLRSDSLTSLLHAGAEGRRRIEQAHHRNTPARAT